MYCDVSTGCWILGLYGKTSFIVWTFEGTLSWEDCSSIEGEMEYLFKIRHASTSHLAHMPFISLLFELLLSPKGRTRRHVAFYHFTCYLSQVIWGRMGRICEGQRLNVRMVHLVVVLVRIIYLCGRSWSG